MNHWSAKHVEFIRQTAPEIAAPIYLLAADESAVDWQPHWQAAFSPLGDLQAQSTLESRGLWQGRGICIQVREDFAAWSQRCQCGTLLHEAAHAIEFLSQADALTTELSPVGSEMLESGESKLLQEAGICRNDLIREQHGANFVRRAMHLYWRARQQVILSPSDLQILHGAYAIGPERYEAVQEALSSELAMSRNLNLTRLSEAPAAFLRLFT